jgi:8-oxo-dGTP pyrophosphatase MutT (NUDIX family)
MDEVATQSGVIPYRLGQDGLQVLLITSRETQRWVIPRGNISGGRSARVAAEREAYEEAGVKGAVESAPLGFYTYLKVLKDGTAQPTTVEVFALRVRKEAKNWPEKAERHGQWMTPQEAASHVQEPGLAALLLQLAKRHQAMMGDLRA